MAKRTPMVHEDSLRLDTDGGSFEVGSPVWFVWLASASSFTFVGEQGHFTARKERPSHGRGGRYWKAYRRWAGRLHRIYLGPSEGLTLDRLQQTAIGLNPALPKDPPTMQTPAAATSLRLIERPTLRLHLLGDFSVTCDDKPVAAPTSSRMQSLLTYLALHHDAPQSRQQLAFLFWPESSEAQSRSNLRQLLHQLRRAWPAADRCLVADATSLAWTREVQLEVDVTEFERALALADQAELRAEPSTQRAALVQALGLYQMDLSPACYDDWISFDRQRLRQARDRAFDRLVALLEARGDYGAAIRFAEDRLLHDPLDEENYLALMRLQAANGDRVGALRVYHTCATMLERELGVEPSSATRAAYMQLMRADSVPVRSVASASALVAAAPLIGREPQWEQLLNVWRSISNGAAHLVVIAGEAGIGKSRLAEDLVMLASRQGVANARSRAYAAEGRLSYAPVTDWLRSDALRAALSRVPSVWLSEVARLLPELLIERSDLMSPEPMTQPWHRQRFFQAVAHAMRSGSQPLLLVLDDLQWCDQDTLEWLHYFLRFDLEAPVLVVGTARSEELGPQRPLATLLADLRGTPRLTELALGPLDRAETEQLAAHLAGRPLNPEQAQRLFDETEGNPLFVVETVRAAVPVAGQLPPATFDLGSLPTKVHAIISERLSQLSEPARETAGLAATIGRAFTLEVLVQASQGDEQSLVRGLDELWQRRLVREQGSDAYDFSHDKIREVAYSNLSGAHRRLLHRQVASALESVCAANLDAVSGQVAMHYEQGGLPEQAVTYHQRAAEVAQRVYANGEAIGFFRKSLAMLASLPPTQERDVRELALQTALGTSLVATQGYGAAEVMAVYQRSWELCQQLGRPPSPPVLRALAIEALAHTEFQQAHELGDHLVSLAMRDDDPVLLVEGHYVLGVTLFWRGAFTPSREHLARALAYYAPSRLPDHLRQYAQDPRVVCLIRMAVDLWFLGDAQLAEQKSVEALHLARELSHPFSLGYALAWNAVLQNQRHDVRATLEQTEAALGLSREHGLGIWLAIATILHGWAVAEEGDVKAGIAEMRDGMTAFRATGSMFKVPYFQGLMAEQYARLGNIERGLALVSEALSTVDRTGERWYEAELHRHRGELLLLRGNESDAEVSFQRASSVARYQQARTLELRAATSLARLRQRRARYSDA